MNNFEDTLERILKNINVCDESRMLFSAIYKDSLCGVSGGEYKAVEHAVMMTALLRIMSDEVICFESLCPFSKAEQVRAEVTNFIDTIDLSESLN